MFATPVIALLLALAAAALPHVVIDRTDVSPSLLRRLNASVSFKHIADVDRTRARVLKSRLGSASRPIKRGVFPVPVSNGLVDYTVVAGIGTPPTNYTLLVDTGSSLTWVGNSKPYVRTSSSQDTGQSVALGSGLSGVSGTGEGFFDTITLGGLVVKDQFIGVSQLTFALGDGLDGILGIGPEDLAPESGFSGATHPIVTDNAFAQHLLDSDEVGILFHPTTSGTPIADGILTFGGVDSKILTSAITTVPITSTLPSSEFVGIDQSIFYGTSTSAAILSNTAGIVDTGTTLVLIASDALAIYQAVTGATLDENTGLLKLSAAQYNSLQSLFFDIGGTTFEFTKNAQIWPRNFNTLIGGDTNSVYLIVGDIGSPSGEGLDFINGLTFLQRFYTVYNSQTPSFGIATTSLTMAETN